MGGFTEQLAPEFFNKSRADRWPRAVCTWNHNPEFLLGTYSSGGLRLTVDGLGLDYTVTLPNCREDLLEMINRGEVTKSSCSFRVYVDSWSYDHETSTPLRTLLSGKLIQVAPATIPPTTSNAAAFGSLARAKDISYREVVDLAGRNELAKLFTRSDSPPTAFTRDRQPKLAGDELDTRIRQALGSR